MKMKKSSSMRKRNSAIFHYLVLTVFVAAILLITTWAFGINAYAESVPSAKIVSPANGSVHQVNQPITVKAKVEGYGQGESNNYFTYLATEVRYNGKKLIISDVCVWNGAEVVMATFTPEKAGTYEILACVYYDTAWGTWHKVPSSIEKPDQKISITVKGSKKVNPLKIKARTAAVKGSTKGKNGKLKKNKTLAATKVIAFTKKGQGKLAYAKVSGNKKIVINKTTGKVTVKKGIKKGTYKVKVKVKAAGNSKYKASVWKTVTFRVNVK